MRLSPPLLLCLTFALAALASAWNGDADTGLHPMDGPDVELRLQRTKAGIRLALRANLVFLDETLGSFRELPNEIAPEEQEQLEWSTLEWLRASKVLRLGDEALPFKKLNATWVPADPERIPYFPREGGRALTYLDLRLDYAMPTDADRLTLVWPTFPINPVLATPGTPDLESAPKIEVKAVLMAGPEERIVSLTHTEPAYSWRLPQGQGADHLLPLPPVPATTKGMSLTLWIVMALGAVLSACMLLRKSPLRLALALGAVGVMFTLGRSSLLTVSADWHVGVAEGAFRTLHGNLYRAFDFHEPEAVYDALEQSVHGDLLEELYREIHTSLVMEEEEGALCRVETVTIQHLQVSELGLQEPLTFGAECTWQVLGVVHHWGHSHQRLLQWRAQFTVQATELGWRLTAAQILETERLPVDSVSEAPPAVQGRTF